MIACLGPLPFTGLFDTGHRILYYLILGLGPGVGGGQVVLVWGEDLASTTPAFHRPITGPFPINSYTHTHTYIYIYIYIIIDTAIEMSDRQVNSRERPTVRRKTGNEL